MPDSKETDIRKDPYMTGFLNRLPDEVRDTYTNAQLLGIKMAMTASKWGVHPIDLRFAVGFQPFKYYIIFLSGKDRRQITRKRNRALRLAEALVISVLLAVIIGSITMIVMLMLLLAQ